LLDPSKYIEKSCCVKVITYINYVMNVRVLLIIAFISSRATTKVTAALIGFLLFLQGCDDEETGDAEVESGSAQPSMRDFLQRDAAAANGLIPGTGGDVPARGNGDWSALGANANQNQWAFRQRFGLVVGSAPIH
jgi:hypothetical protein